MKTDLIVVKKAVEIIKAIRNKEVSASMSTIEQFPKEVIDLAKEIIDNES